MFRSASQIDSERTASSLRRIKANWERTADSWFDGSVDSIDRRTALCEKLIHQASQATARLLDRPESGHYMKLASDLQADHQALTQMRRDLLTAASDRDHESWADERMRWENAHPEWKPFREDSDSQRQQNLRENY